MQVKKFLIKQPSRASHHFLPLSSKSCEKTISVPYKVSMWAPSTVLPMSK